MTKSTKATDEAEATDAIKERREKPSQRNEPIGQLRDDDPPHASDDEVINKTTNGVKVEYKKIRI